MSILIIADHDNQQLSGSTLNTVSAATVIGGDIHLLIAGESCRVVAEQAASVVGVSQVYFCDHSAYKNAIAENISALVVGLAAAYSHILFTASNSGKNIMPRVAALLDVAGLSDIISIESEDTFVRPVYAGNALATVKSHDVKKVMTIRSTSFEAVEAEGGAAEIMDIEVGPITDLVEFLGAELSHSDRPQLISAKIVISGGRGMQNGDNFKLIEAIATKLNAAVGASRAAVDAGFVHNEYQVGQTGKVVAPDLYIAVGISGAIQHLAGMKDSKVIVAINKDEDAPIFQVADYGIVADLFDILPELYAAL